MPTPPPLPAALFMRILLLAFVALLPLIDSSALQTSSEPQAPSIVITTPVSGAEYSTSGIPLQLQVSNFELGGKSDGHVCVEVLWDKGIKSFCKDQVEEWVMRGFETGNYLVTVQLRHGADTAAVMVAEERANFNVVLSAEETVPRLFISFPAGDDRILTGPEVEVRLFCL